MRSKFILIVLLQVLLLCGIIAYREFWLANGERIVLKTVPVDPRDIFRGDYVNLTYDISNMNIDIRSEKREFLPYQPVFIELGTDPDRTSFATAINKERPANGRFIKGRVKSEYTDSKWDITFREDSGQVKEFHQAWLQELKKGDILSVCIDNQGNLLSYYKDDSSFKQLCIQGIQPIHGVIEEITEIKTRKVNVEYGIESYFVEEGTGNRIEQGRAVTGPVKVEVSLREDGQGIISRLLLDRK